MSISTNGGISAETGISANNGITRAGGISAAETVEGEDVTAPSGYSVAFTTDPISDVNAAAAAFQFAGAEVGATYEYTISSNGGGTNVTGNGTISTATDIISGINVSGLGDGTLTLSVTLTDANENTGTPATDTVTKEFNVLTDISSIYALLDASNTASITSSGGATSQISDLTGNNRHGTQATSNRRPITGSRTVNGHNVLDFDGTDDSLILHSDLHSLPAGPNTFIIVAACDSNIPNPQRLLSGKVTTNTNYGVLLFTGTTQFRNCTSAGAATVAMTNNTNPHIFVLRRNGTALTPGYDTLNTANANNNATDQTLTELVLGWDNAFTGGQAFNGVFALAAAFNDDLTDAQINRYCAKLAAKYGTTWTPV